MDRSGVLETVDKHVLSVISKDFQLDSNRGNLSIMLLLEYRILIKITESLK